MARSATFHRCALLLAAAVLVPACGTGSGPVHAHPGSESPSPSPSPSPAPSPSPSPTPSVEPAPSSPGPAGPAFLASVTQGLAPLGVVFSAVRSSVNGSGEGIVQPADGDHSTFHYAWDYGDPDAGTWPTSLRSRNADTGFVGAHVYEKPGTYTCTLKIIDRGGAEHTYAQQIRVSAWTGTTYYVSDLGNDANAGTSEAAPWRTIAKVMQNLGPNRRFLFRRGGSYASGAFLGVNAAGPGMFGAYGPSTSPRPVLQLGSQFMVYQDDWRFVDLELRGPADGPMGLSLASEGGIDRLLALRVAVRGFGVGLGWSNVSGAPPNDGVVVADCEGTGAAVNGLFVGGRRLALLGNRFSRPQTSHVCRVWQANRSVISHNEFLIPGGDRHALKLHGPPAGHPVPTEHVVVSNNRFQGQLWNVIVAPQNTVSDEPVSHVLLERNRSLSTAMTQEHYVVEARDVTLRNNLLDGTLSNGVFTGIAIGSAGVVPPPGRIRIENNTFYRGSAGSARLVAVPSDAFGVEIRNNLGSFPLASSKAVVQGGHPGLVAENNLLTDVPGFADPAAGDFHLLPSSPARDNGLPSVRVRDDYNAIPRPQGSAPDRGAFEQ